MKSSRKIQDGIQSFVLEGENKLPRAKKVEPIRQKKEEKRASSRRTKKKLRSLG